MWGTGRAHLLREADKMDTREPKAEVVFIRFLISASKSS